MFNKEEKEVAVILGINCYKYYRPMYIACLNHLKNMLRMARLDNCK